MGPSLVGILLSLLLLVSADVTRRLVAPVAVPAGPAAVGGHDGIAVARDDDDDDDFEDDDEDEEDDRDDDDDMDDVDEIDDDDRYRDDTWGGRYYRNGGSLRRGTRMEPAAATGAGIARGPYLQMATPTAITIRWRTSSQTRSRVRYGIAPDLLDRRKEEPAASLEHEVRLTGLEPDTRYYYSIETGQSVLAGGPGYFFRTSPPVGAARRVRVWMIGDSGLRGRGQQRVQDAFDAFSDGAPTDVWLLLGDNAYAAGTGAQYQAGFFDPFRERLRSTVVWPARGNHDQVRNGANNDYYDFFTLPQAGEAGGTASGTEAYFSFDFANIHFVCLDAEQLEGGAGNSMVSWLRRDLGATRQDWLIAFWHHPPYSRGSHDSDRDALMAQVRKRVVPVLEAGGADLVVTGHSHSYERSYLLNGHYGPSASLRPSMILDRGDGRPNGDGPYRKPTYGRLAPNEGTVYAVVGSSSKLSGGRFGHPAHARSIRHLGSLVVDVDGRRLDAAFVDENGSVDDRFSILKGHPLSDRGGPSRGLDPGERNGGRVFGGPES